MIVDERARGAWKIPAPERPAPPSWVYALRGGDRIKIGRSSIPDKRIETLRATSPIPLGLLVLCPGGAPAERLIHRYLGPWRTHGEWFTATDEVVALADTLRLIARTATDHEAARADLFDLLTAAVEIEGR